MFDAKAARPVFLTFLSIASLVSVVPIVGCGTTANSSPVSGTGGDPGGDKSCANLTLATTQTVAAGDTLTICAGSTIAAASGASLIVDGTLQIQGTAASPVKLVGETDTAGAWTGLVLNAGAQVTATYLQIHDADTAIAARPGSTYSFDHLLIDTSSAMLVLSSSGTIAHGTLRGLGDSQSESPVLINNASPQFTNTSVTQGLYNGVDMIVIAGSASAPLFDHVEVADSHCAFHFNESTGATISNSFVHHNAYGMMTFGSQSGHFNHSNWEDNAINIGTCNGGIADEVTQNYFAGTPFDGSCTSLTATATATAPYPTSVVGPQP